MPSMMVRWSLSNSEAGWITSAFYAAYMVSVPVLVTLTERIDAKRVYLFGVGGTTMAHLAFGLLAEGFWSALALRALAGVSWAGTYIVCENINNLRKGCFTFSLHPQVCFVQIWPLGDIQLTPTACSTR